MRTTGNPFDAGQIRDDHIPKAAYLDPAFARLEEERLWPRVWQIACRVEEIAEIGDFITYDIANDSLLIVRSSADTIKAFHNVCPHRGRRLREDCGHIGKVVCRFHGWSWTLNGDNIRVVDRDDWKGCLSDADVRLKEARVETWGGFVFINMDPGAEPLAGFLAPVNQRCDKFEFDKLRYRWYKTVVLPCNWKCAVEAFDEAYHVQQTHPQILKYFEDYSLSSEYGRHGAFWYPNDKEGNYPLIQSSRLNQERHTDYRKYVLDFVEEFNSELKAMVTPRAYAATQRLRTEVPADASQLEVMTKWAQFQIEAAQADGSGWPAELSPEYIAASHVDWHVFPNTVFLHSSVDGVLWYRARPDGSNPDSCIFDIWSLARFAPGAEPPLKREFYADWREHDWGRILTQDFTNLVEMQRGMKSRAFTGSRTNPVQERVVSNFHRVLRDFLDGDTQVNSTSKSA